MRAAYIKQADDMLADAYWWLKGFAEARQANCVMGEQPGEGADLARKIQEVRSFLERVNEGRIRRLGEETAIVLTFAEWERFCDFLLIKPDGIEERDIASKTARAIHDQYREQEEQYRLSRMPDAPF